MHLLTDEDSVRCAPLKGDNNKKREEKDRMYSYERVEKRGEIKSR
jgi:hypothetical protein